MTPLRRTILQSRWRPFSDFSELRTFMTGLCTSAERFGRAEYGQNFRGVSEAVRISAARLGVNALWDFRRNFTRLARL